MTEAKKLALAQRLFFLYFTKHFLNLGRVLLDERRAVRQAHRPCKIPELAEGIAQSIANAT
jgi:hypothetical protein